MDFVSTVRTYSDKVRQYEKPECLNKAKATIPIQNLREKAEIKYAGAQGQLSLSECILIELLNWFKMEFFKWMDSPKCEDCQSDTSLSTKATPSAEESSFGASTVECYRCPKCQTTYRFPRYNDPVKLLETRKGRCGEWANCFTLCCRAMDFDARLILDLSDHVWTEVYSTRQRRWLHVDPCENVCDKPHLYEKGWGKKLTYIFGFSKHEVQDVTWRYVSNFQEVQRRRNDITEEALVELLLKQTFDLQVTCPAQVREKLLERRVLELAEFLTPNTNEGLVLGRTSGALEWRLARMETGEAYVIQPTDFELQSKTIVLKYSCKTDEYQRGSEIIKGWRALTFKRDGIFRKEEPDWNMTYLCRNETVDRGLLSWKFDLTKTQAKIEHITISGKVTLYHSGTANWKVANEHIERTQLGSCQIDTDEFVGGKHLELEASLTGGLGDLAWQHSQIFRESLVDDTTWSLSIHITLQL